MKKKSCLGRYCCCTAQLLPLLIQVYGCFGQKSWKSSSVFLPVLNVWGRKKADKSHKHHSTLQCSSQCSCGCPHLDLCLLPQPCVTLILCIGLQGSTCCHVPTSSATAQAKVSMQTATAASVSSWASLVVHGKPCYPWLCFSCGIGFCHLCFYSVLKCYETGCAQRCEKAPLLHGLGHVVSSPLVLRGSVKIKLK